MRTHMLREDVMVKATNGVAVAGIFSPAWLPSLQELSTISAQLVPIFSLLWLILQIVRHIRKPGSEK